MGGRGAVCLSLPLPEAHLGFWQGLDEAQLCAMGRCLADGDKEDLPDGIDGDLAVWGDAPWVHVGGLDLAEELTVSLWSAGCELDEDAAPGAIAGITACFTNQPMAIPFDRPIGRTCLLYSEYEKAGYFHQIEDGAPFDAEKFSLKIQEFPALASHDLSLNHLLFDVYYDAVMLSPEIDYFYDYGQSARLVRF